MRKLGMFLISLLLLAGCTTTDDLTLSPSTQALESEDEEIYAAQEYEWRSVHEELMRIAYKPEMFKDLIKEEMEHWSNPEKTIYFTIKNSLKKEQQVLGLFHAPTEWEITGNLNQEQLFRMTNQNESVILEYDQRQRTLAVQEFSYFLPSHHLELIHEILQQEEYRRLEWEKGQEYWQVSLQSSLASLSNDIHAYLFQDDGKNGLIKKQLADFIITYTLSYALNEGVYSLEGILFSIEKQGKKVNGLEFIL